jgi:predicted ATPase
VGLLLRGDPTRQTRRADGRNEEVADAIGALPQNSLHLRYLSFLRELAGGLRCDGQLEKASATVERALDMSRRDDELCCIPDLLRVKGEIAAARVASDEAEADFRESIDLAHRQTALSWELRSATSFARLRQEQGRPKEALDLLAAIYGRFTEGFDTKDVRDAKRRSIH